MTEAEAINILQLNTPFVASKEANKAVEVAIKALKKQIAKPLFGNEENPIHIGYIVNGLCPNCFTEFVCITPRYYKENGFGYCKQCGQKLDWNEV